MASSLLLGGLDLVTGKRGLSVGVALRSKIDRRGKDFCPGSSAWI